MKFPPLSIMRRSNILAGITSHIRNSPMKAIAADFPHVPDVYLYSEVSTDSCLQLITSLKENKAMSELLHQNMNMKDPVPIHLHIQSPGGSAVSGLHISDIVRSHSVPIYTFLDGMAANAASLISVSGKKRYMTRHSMMLIHQPSISLHNSNFKELTDEQHKTWKLFLMPC